MSKPGTAATKRGRPRKSTKSSKSSKSRSAPSSKGTKKTAKKSASGEKPAPKKRSKKAMDPINRKVGQSVSMPMWLWGRLAERASEAGMNLSGYVEGVMKKHLEADGETLPQASKVKYLEGQMVEMQKTLDELKKTTA